jgi:hypothetical protein
MVDFVWRVGLVSNAWVLAVEPSNILYLFGYWYRREDLLFLGLIYFSLAVRTTTAAAAYLDCISGAAG